LVASNQVLARLDKALVVSNQVLAKLDKALVVSNQVLAKLDKALFVSNQVLASLDKRLSVSNQALASFDEVLGEARRGTRRAAMVRTVEVRSPSATAETVGVLKAVFHILFWSAIAIGIERSQAAASGAPATLPGEIAFRDIPSADQRMYRELQEGVLEAESRRSAEKRWPAVEALAAAGVPPFAPDPLDRAHYVWSLAQRDVVINYRGVPADPAAPSFLLIAIEPNPGDPVDPTAPTDEIHHRLADGMLIHVSTWKGPRLPDGVVAYPPADRGWQRIAAGGN
jgi:hypothetical protein